MKKLVFFLLLLTFLQGCGGGGGDESITVILEGIANQVTGQGGQTTPALGAIIKVVELNKSDEVTQNKVPQGSYTITGVPVGGTYTVNITTSFINLVDINCTIQIPNTSTLTITNDGNGACVAGASAPGVLVMNITLN